MPKTAPTTTTEDPAVSAAGEQYRELDAAAYAASKGDGEARETCEHLRVRLGLSVEQVKARLERIIERKKQAAAEKAKSEAGPSGTGGVVLEEHRVEDVYLTRDLVETFVRRDHAMPLPRLDSVRWHPGKGVDADEFKYLLSILSDVAAGVIQPGRVALIVADRNENRELPPVQSALPLIFSDNLPIGFIPASLHFIRRPGQTQASLDKALKMVQKSVEQLRTADGIDRLHATRPAMAAGGPRQW